MFNYIEGTVAETSPGGVVLDCGGIGYEINTSLNTLSALSVGKKARLYIAESIKEDAFDLYGFATKGERRSYGLLIGVSGVGPKAAISILSSNTPEKLAMSVISGDERALTSAPGVGKKIAQRIILELKDKIARDQKDFGLPDRAAETAAAIFENNKLGDAAAALSALGYGAGEINAALRGVDISVLSTEEIIKRALKNTMN